MYDVQTGSQTDKSDNYLGGCGLLDRTSATPLVEPCL
jgi:hypothetical protein